MLSTAILIFFAAQEPNRGVQPIARSAKKLALVIGNQRYVSGALANPVGDAELIARVVRKTGFDVVFLHDLNLRSFEEKLNSFVNAVGSGDTVFFYYAGHGVQIEGENYLLPVDFRSERQTDVKYRAINVSQFLEGLESQSPRSSVVVLDACRDNPFSSTRGGRNGLAGLAAGQGTFIAFATGPGRTAQDGIPGRHSLFASATAKWLGDSALDVASVFENVKVDVYQASSRAQVPWISSSLVGKLYLHQGDPKTDAGEDNDAGILVAAESDPANSPSEIDENPYTANRPDVRLTSVQRDLIKAMTRACVSGTLDACYELGTAFEVGQFGEPSLDKAIYAFSRACQFGEKRSCAKLSSSPFRERRLSGGFGRLTIEAPEMAGARVLVDGMETYRTTPIDRGTALVLIPGKHVIRLVFKDGRKQDGVVDIVLKQTTEMKFGANGVDAQIDQEVSKRSPL